MRAVAELFQQQYQRDNWIDALAQRLPVDEFSRPVPINNPDFQDFAQLGRVILDDGGGGEGAADL